jgi:hypothetical protein
MASGDQTPPIGQVVERLENGTWTRDWLRQARIGDELFVLIWGSGLRHAPGITWRPT